MFLSHSLSLSIIATIIDMSSVGYIDRQMENKSTRRNWSIWLKLNDQQWEQRYEQAIPFIRTEFHIEMKLLIKFISSASMTRFRVSEHNLSEFVDKKATKPTKIQHIYTMDTTHTEDALLYYKKIYISMSMKWMRNKIK